MTERRRAGWGLIALILTGCPPEKDFDAPPKTLEFDCRADPNPASAQIDEFAEVDIVITALDDELPNEFTVEISSDDEEIVGVPREESIDFGEGTTSPSVSSDDSSISYQFEPEDDAQETVQSIRFLCKKDGTANFRIRIEGVTLSVEEGTERKGTFRERHELMIQCGSATFPGDGDGDGDSTNFGDPILEHPCEAFTEEDIAALVGTPVIEMNTLDTDNRRVCEFTPADGAGGTRLRLEAGINSNADGLFEEWKNQRAGASETEEITWSPEGELRIANGTASAWAYVRNDDPIGRDIYIWVEGLPWEGQGGTPSPIADLKAATESSAQDLNSFLLSVQIIEDN